MNVAIPGYENLVELARHGGGALYQAWQPAFSRRVAVHVLHGRTADELEAALRAGAPLAGHPHVVEVHDCGVTATGAAYLVTELLEPYACRGGEEAVRRR